MVAITTEYGVAIARSQYFRGCERELAKFKEGGEVRRSKVQTFQTAAATPSALAALVQSGAVGKRGTGASCALAVGGLHLQVLLCKKNCVRSVEVSELELMVAKVIGPW